MYSGKTAQEIINRRNLFASESTFKKKSTFNVTSNGSDNCYICKIGAMVGIQEILYKFRMQAFRFVGIFYARQGKNCMYDQFCQYKPSHNLYKDTVN